LEKLNEASKTKRAVSIRKAIRHIWKKRASTFRTKRRRGDPDKMPSFGTQPLSGSDDAASQGRQDNDFERRKLPNRLSCSLFRIERL
jgi:hypothetical protein